MQLLILLLNCPPCCFATVVLLPPPFFLNWPHYGIRFHVIGLVLVAHVYLRIQIKKNYTIPSCLELVTVKSESDYDRLQLNKLKIQVRLSRRQDLDFTLALEFAGFKFLIYWYSEEGVSTRNDLTPKLCRPKPIISVVVHSK